MTKTLLAVVLSVLLLTINAADANNQSGVVTVEIRSTGRNREKMRAYGFLTLSRITIRW